VEGQPPAYWWEIEHATMTGVDDDYMQECFEKILEYQAKL